MNGDFLDFYRKMAVEWRIKREVARHNGDYVAYKQARKECNNYAAKLPENEKAEFWEA